MSEIFGHGTVDLEKSVIGAILVKPEILHELPWLECDHFAHWPCRAAWESIRNLEAAGKPIDIVTLEAELERSGRLSAVGGTDASGAGVAELALWVNNFPSVDSAIEYANQVREHALHRRVLVALGEAETRGRRGDVYGTDLLSDAIASLTSIDASDVADASQNIGELVKEHVKVLEAEAQRRMSGKVELTGVPTGVESLDNEIGGWPFGIVSVICARPGHGKSSLGMATADAASEKGFGVHVFSMEDPRRMYMNRALSRVSGIAVNSISTANLNKGDLAEFTRASRSLSRRKDRWLVDDRSGIPADEIVRSVRRHRKANNTKVVIVDYLQLIAKARRSLAKSRHEQITETIHELADAAKNDQMAYVVMSQLNRGLESRDDKRPTQPDLRESGTIEERAKTIIGMYRGPKYSKEPQEGIDEDENGQPMSQWRYERTVQLLVIKNSQGASPVRILANWDDQTTKVS